MSDDPFKPYKGKLEDYSSIPEKGQAEDEILNVLSGMAEEENNKWKKGQVDRKSVV